MGDKGPKASAKLKAQKRAAASLQTGRKKHAVEAPALDAARSRALRFRLADVDLGGPWCLTTIAADEHRQLLEFMGNVETQTLSELIPDRLKREDVAGASPNPEARKRAQDRYPDDHDFIHSLRVSGAIRLWGLLRDHEFAIIWWDPTHDVWPTKRVTGN